MDIRKIDYMSLYAWSKDGKKFEVDFKGKNTFGRMFEVIKLIGNGSIEFK